MDRRDGKGTGEGSGSNARPKTGHSHGIFYVDVPEWIFLMMVSSIYTVSVLYSIYYMKDIESRGISEEMYFVLMNLFTASMLFSLLMNNYGFM